MHPDPAALARSSGAAPSGYPLLSFGAAGGAYPVAVPVTDTIPALRARFAELHDAGLWQTRRNAILAELGTGT